MDGGPLSPRVRLTLAPLRRAKRWFEHLSSGQQATFLGAVLAAIIAGVFGLFTVLLTSFLADPGGGSTSSPSPPATSVRRPSPPAPSSPAAPIPLETVLAPLGSSSPEIRKNGISALKLLIQNPAESPQRRRAVLQRLASFVRDRAPSLPSADTYGYCLKPKDTQYPTDAGLALEALGARLGQDANFPIDLSRVNLAYSNLQRLDLRNINFDGALLCRTFLNRSRFDGATFGVAIVRFSFMNDATGLTVSQLGAAYTLYKTELPSALASSAVLAPRVRTDPDFSPQP
jgi:hypothetical protein